MRKTSALMLLLGAVAVLSACEENTTVEQSAMVEQKTMAAAGAAPAVADYADAKNWLCLPGLAGACETDLDTTVVETDGTFLRQAWQANPAPDIDCFYVYPTVSLDKSMNSDLVAGPEERSVVQTQFARFASVCRTFAPVYRQVTLAGLRANMANQAEPDMSIGYRDVRAAWQYYMEHHNQGRGVVLVGHSQGTFLLSQLLQEEIEGQAVERQLVSALMIGGRVQVPKGKLQGGSFSSLPLCERGDQLGCVIAYTSFRASSPPPVGGLFGQVQDNLVNACTNPALLASGTDRLNSFLATGDGGYSTKSAAPQWVAGKVQPDTPFVQVPGLLAAQCVENDEVAYLAIEVMGDPQDLRTDDINGDLVVAGQVQKAWGLHLIDMDLAMGDLLSIVQRQSDTYLSQLQ